MEVLHHRCTGLDVHKDTVVACARIAVDGTVEQHVQTFATTTSALMALQEWLQSYGCTHVAMEATGVYWKPVWHLLEDSFALVLANAAHIRNVPGRKTDVNDATWTADLLAHNPRARRSFFLAPGALHRGRGRSRARISSMRARHPADPRASDG